MIDPALECQHHLETLVRERSQHFELAGEVLTDTLPVAEDVPGIISFVGKSDEVVQLGQGLDRRQRHEVTPAKASDLTFDATFLVCPFLAGQAEERVEAVVASERHEALGLFAVSALQHPCNGGLQVVIADANRHASEVLEGSDVSVDEDLLSFVGIDAVEGLSRRGEPHDEHPPDDLFTAKAKTDLAEVDLGLFARWMGLGNLDRNEGNRATSPGGSDIATNSRLTDLGAVFFDQPLEDAPCRVMLLSRSTLIGRQPGIDRGLPRIE